MRERGLEEAALEAALDSFWRERILEGGAIWRERILRKKEEEEEEEEE